MTRSLDRTSCFGRLNQLNLLPFVAVVDSGVTVERKDVAMGNEYRPANKTGIAKRHRRIGLTLDQNLDFREIFVGKTKGPPFYDEQATHLHLTYAKISFTRFPCTSVSR